MKPNVLITLLAPSLLSFVGACQQQLAKPGIPPSPPPEQTETHPLQAYSSPKLKLVMAGTTEQVGKTTGYDPSYQSIDYPNGDVPIETGVCSDVIVRAFRKASVDLQKDIHEDMKESFSAYPKKWGLNKPDANIDHRRVPNLMTYFTRKGKSLATTTRAEDYTPGDIVTWDLGNGVDHIGIVVNVWSKPAQRYLVVHNIGAGARMEDVMFSWRLTGHYRFF
jgi:uncharacterized protein